MKKCKYLSMIIDTKQAWENASSQLQWQVPSVHSNKSFEEVLNYFSPQTHSISRIYSSFLLLTKSHKQLEATSFFRYSLQAASKETLEVGTQKQQQQWQRSHQTKYKLQELQVKKMNKCYNITLFCCKMIWHTCGAF